MKMENKKNKIILTGGGTAGSVTPLLAVVDELKNKIQPEYIWIGTKNGPEKFMVEREGIKFMSILNGKLRRYFCWQNFVDPFKIIGGFIQSIIILIKEKPDLVMSAGGFVSVPIVWAAGILRIPVLIHQLDARPGLANKLMAPFAKVITTTFEKSLNDYGKKAVWIGGLMRNKLLHERMTKREALSKLGLRYDKPVIFVIGGGTGSKSINDLIIKNLESLTKFTQIVHITGKNRVDGNIPIDDYEGYRPFEFLDINGMFKCFTASEVVVSRCGMGLLTELSFLGKPSVLIPMPSSHQEDNAKIFTEQNAAIVLSEKELTDKQFVSSIEGIIKNIEKKTELQKNIKKVIIRGGNEKIVEIILNLISGVGLRC